jgi:geranylgeranyl pyrophosphate synthase
MDNDDLRRGRPTVHRVYGVATAMAAGVAMVPLAARAVYDACEAMALPGERTGGVLRELMRASGAGGMIGGQWLDLEAEGRELALAELEHLHRAKTGMLITASTRIGALAASADADTVQALTVYGAALGLAYQIADDVLDVTGTSDQLGKTAGKDLVLHKSTYPSLLGVAGALARARGLSRDAVEALRLAGRSTPELERLARYVVERRS